HDFRAVALDPAAVVDDLRSGIVEHSPAEAVPRPVHLAPWPAEIAALAHGCARREQLSEHLRRQDVRAQAEQGLKPAFHVGDAGVDTGRWRHRVIAVLYLSGHQL